MSNLFFLDFICMSFLPACMYICVPCAYSAQGHRKRDPDHLVLELKVLVNPMWMLRIELQFSVRALSHLWSSNP